MKVFIQQQVAIYKTFRALQKHVLFFRTGNKFMFLLHMKNIDYCIRLSILSKKMIEIGYYSQWLRLYGMSSLNILIHIHNRHIDVILIYESLGLRL